MMINAMVFLAAPFVSTFKLDETGIKLFNTVKGILFYLLSPIYIIPIFVTNVTTGLAPEMAAPLALFLVSLVLLRNFTGSVTPQTDSTPHNVQRKVSMDPKLVYYFGIILEILSGILALVLTFNTKTLNSNHCFEHLGINGLTIRNAVNIPASALIINHAMFYSVNELGFDKDFDKRGKTRFTTVYVFMIFPLFFSSLAMCGLNLTIAPEMTVPFLLFIVSIVITLKFAESVMPKTNSTNSTAIVGELTSNCQQLEEKRKKSIYYICCVLQLVCGALTLGLTFNSKRLNSVNTDDDCDECCSLGIRNGITIRNAVNLPVSGLMIANAILWIFGPFLANDETSIKLFNFITNICFFLLFPFGLISLFVTNVFFGLAPEMAAPVTIYIVCLVFVFLFALNTQDSRVTNTEPSTAIYVLRRISYPEDMTNPATPEWNIQENKTVEDALPPSYNSMYGDSRTVEEEDALPPTYIY